MAPIDTLRGKGELQELHLRVKYSIAISKNPSRPTRLIGEGKLESATEDPLPGFAMNQQTVLTLEDGRKIKIQILGTSQSFVLLNGFF